jgi:uncharacterized protein (DUF1015 family)
MHHRAYPGHLYEHRKSEYVHQQGRRGIEMVAKEKADIAFLLNPPTMEDVLEVAEAGLRMPHASTYFYPKTPAGLVFHSLE